MIRFNNVTKRFGDKEVLKGQSFEIKDGEFLVLVGPSGSGKTTLLKMINRLVDLTDGHILMDGLYQKDLDVRELRLSTGYVLQQIALFPNLTVAENIALIPEMKGWDKARIKERTKELLKRVDLEPSAYLDRYPKDLSGGEQQRVGIVRALIHEPKYLLMDEPFSALDPITRQQLRTLTKELHEEFDMTTIFVTHDVREALALADRIAVLNQGVISQLATPEEILSQPADDFVADLFGGVTHD
ncbi:glycine betaine/L-proline ABC transporter ATP-binding protein [Streptococcus criceti]|uniref:ABC-type quaternary amine transporter n=1 Tax=Streptococcus criceti HS-6 TaxID=873449 RepID=G5JRE4_STRCG|nr:ABC transporter ATP-binding protein [Streptococcus criceti]EHI74033.1 putative choline ABC transporter, ATP-binding protein [Streptococcus criceti HS-6]SUN43735.1 glycine betaine/L-proline ABC transporter ATP-binding protein [Streptococcus criceti]